MPGEGVQRPGKHHCSWGVFPELVPDPCHHLEGQIWLSRVRRAAQRQAGMKLMSPGSFQLKEALGVDHLL